MQCERIDSSQRGARDESLPIVWLFCSYFVCLLLIALVRDLAGQPPLSAPIEGIAFRTMNDPHSFATAALEIHRHGWVTPGSMWILHLWPPGFVVLEAVVLNLFGESAPFVGILMALSALAGACMLTAGQRCLALYVPSRWSVLLPLLPFLFPVTRLFLLQPVGLILGEGFSVMFFLTAVFLLVQALSKRSVWGVVGSGAFMAASAYFRSQYELIVSAMSIFSILIVGIWLSRRRSRAGTAARDAVQLKFTVLGIAASMLVANALMVPWRIHNYLDIKRFGWVQTQELVIRNSLTPVPKLLEAGGRFVVDGGGHLACSFEPSYCDSPDARLFYKAFAKHAASWFLYKVRILPVFWFSSMEGFPDPNTVKVPWDVVSNLFILACMIATVPLLWLTRRRKVFIPMAWISLSFYSCFFVIFTLVQFEMRYFFLMKIFSLYSALLLGCALLREQRDSVNPQKTVAREGGLS